MEKLLEKRNFGIPVTILTAFAFIIGYSLTQDFSTLLVAILFAFMVFVFPFDDRVKLAVKQSYIICFVSNLIYLGFSAFYQFVKMVTPADYNFNFFQAAMNNIYTYGLLIVNVAVIVVYMIFLIFALIRKDMNIGIISNVLGEGTPKPAPVYQQPMPQQMYQQPMQPQSQSQTQPQPQPVPQPNYNQPIQQPNYNQPVPQPNYNQPVQQPMYQQPQPMYQQPIPQPQKPVPPAEQPSAGIKCSKCGTVNQPGALFCASCGTKL